MRRIALALLVVVTGCNEIFGVHRTKHVDAPPDSPDAPFDAMWLPITFDQQLGTTDTSGAPLPAMQVAFDVPPTIQVGALTGALQALTYDASIPGVRVPPEILQGPWRMVYQLADDPVPTEIQWSVGSAHLTLPTLERPGDSLPPAGSGYKITPSGTAPTCALTYGFPEIVTSGAITDSLGSNTSGTEIDFPYDTNASPLLGGLGTPHSGMGDWVALLAWCAKQTTTTVLYEVVGYAIPPTPDLVAGTLTASTPAWATATSSYSPIDFATLMTQPRMNNAIGSYGGTCCMYHVDYGLLPNPHIAPMSAKRKSAGTNSIAQAQPPPGLELPVLLSLYSYHDPNSPPASVVLADPPTSTIPLTRAFYARMARNSRIVLNNSIESSLQEISTSTSFKFAATFSVGAMFSGTSLAIGGPPPVTVTLPATGPAVLTWTTESGHPADDYVVTLYKVIDQKLVPLARYQVLQPSVNVDSALMTPSNTYIFGIVSRNGFPGVQGGSPDYTAVSLPFSEATTFPFEFTVQ
jgi:hypothetical protein